jgi:adenine/guanine phosphoribosyltransferase-like PRPP-binding protein
MAIQSTYLQKVYQVNRFVKIIDKAADLAKRIKRIHKYDTIAFSGSSGAALAYVLSAQMKMPLIHIRKDDGYHPISDSKFEGNACVKKYVIVDDFIESGSTISYIRSTIKKVAPKAKCAAIMLYAQASPISDVRKVPIYRL